MSVPTASMVRRSESEKFRIPINIINLEKDKTRWEKVVKQLTLNADVPTEAICRYPAVYGKELDRNELVANTTLLGRYFCTRGMIGCFLSHRNVWSRVLEGEAQHQMILEDDVVVPPDFYARVGALLDHMEECDETQDGNWDALLLGAFLSVEPGKRAFPFQVATLGGARVPRVVSPYVHVPHRPLGCHAYILSKRGAAKLLERVFKANYHVDAVAWSCASVDMEIFLCHPMLAFQDSSCSSTVGGVTGGLEMALPMWEMDSYSKVPLVWYMNEPFFRIPVLDIVVTIFRFYGLGFIVSMWVALHSFLTSQASFWAFLLHLGVVMGPGFVIVRTMLVPAARDPPHQVQSCRSNSAE